MVNIIGAGLSGVEAAYYLANHNILVNLYEMRPLKMTPAHEGGNFAELICSNSLRAKDMSNAVGLLKKEMEMLDSLIIKAAYKFEVSAGGALAVDRHQFSEYITKEIKNHPNIKVINEEVSDLLEGPLIIASGPLTSDLLSQKLKETLNENDFYFFDAIAPIIDGDSIDYNKVYLKSRYDKGEAAYLNCPMTKMEFEAFYEALINAECVIPKDFELKVFEGCMPLEVMAKRGKETLLFGPLKPVGLEHNGNRPYAVVQLRKENTLGSMYNLVGFQTHLKWGEQLKILKMIPGLENVKILRYGVMHKNTYINSPKVLNPTYQSKINPNLFFAGQITGVEGYVESAASGIVAGINVLRMLNHQKLLVFPEDTMIGAMAHYITSTTNLVPMNANFGIIKPLDNRVNKKDKKMLYATRALDTLKVFLEEHI